MHTTLPKNSLIERDAFRSQLAVTVHIAHDGNPRPAGKLHAHQDDEKDFSLKKLRRSQYFGYKFGYRHQFALISASYAKLQA
jgi:hypothetical protein